MLRPISLKENRSVLLLEIVSYKTYNVKNLEIRLTSRVIVEIPYRRDSGG